METRDTDAGELEFPIIKGWPNQGVGRVNPDGSLGACSACHTRHLFSAEEAKTYGLVDEVITSVEEGVSQTKER